MATQGTSAAAILTGQLIAASIPVDGVCDNGDGTFTIQYSANATAANRTAGAAIQAGFNGKGRGPRSASSIMNDVKALTNQQQNTLLLAIAASFLQQNPGIAALAGISIAGDQPDV